MRQLIAGLLLILMAGCASVDYAAPQENEIDLRVAYAAMGQPYPPYPLTVDVIVGCDYYRLPGESERRPLPDLAPYMLDTRSLDWIIGPQEWSEQMCADL